MLHVRTAFRGQFFYHMGPGDPNQVTRMDGKCLYPLKHLPDQYFFLSSFLMVLGIGSQDALQASLKSTIYSRLALNSDPISSASGMVVL